MFISAGCISSFVKIPNAVLRPSDTPIQVKRILHVNILEFLSKEYFLTSLPKLTGIFETHQKFN